MTRTNPLQMTWTPSPDWMADAACRDTKPEVFFAKDSAPAKVVCGGCAVVATCRKYALENYIEAGTWGALSEDERKAIKPRPNRPRPGFERKD